MLSCSNGMYDLVHRGTCSHWICMKCNRTYNKKPALFIERVLLFEKIKVFSSIQDFAPVQHLYLTRFRVEELGTIHGVPAGLQYAFCPVRARCYFVN